MTDGFDGVIFDMDGTIVLTGLDFLALRRELGVPAHVGLIEGIEAMPQPQQRQAWEYLLAREMAAARESVLMAGARQTLEAIEAAGLKTALLTRNAAACMKMVLERFDLRFDLTWSREDGPVKPKPDGVLNACRVLGLSPPRTACVGDFHYDVTAANAAGAVSVLLCSDPRPAWADEARHVIGRLIDLLPILGVRM